MIKRVLTRPFLLALYIQVRLFLFSFKRNLIKKSLMTRRQAADSTNVRQGEVDTVGMIY
jgi:hypothetical protein